MIVFKKTFILEATPSYQDVLRSHCVGNAKSRVSQETLEKNICESFTWKRQSNEKGQRGPEFKTLVADC